MELCIKGLAYLILQGKKLHIKGYRDSLEVLLPLSNPRKPFSTNGLHGFEALKKK